jgi:hypothetical protein
VPNWKSFVSPFARLHWPTQRKSTSRRGGRSFQARFESLEGRALLAASVAGDFNGDGVADLAIGMPDQTVNSAAGAGQVKIVYGTIRQGTLLTGLTPNKSQLLSESSLGRSSQANDGFGTALAVGDFNRDGILDLAIGSPGTSGTGAVFIVYGSRSGLRSTAAQVWTETSINRAPTAGDHFGSALAAGDFDNNHWTDLAVGIPNKSAASNANAGAVAIIYGRTGHLRVIGNQLWDQSKLSAGSVAAGDLFGSALAAGDFNADGFRDLAVGAPGQTVSGNAGAGAVNVIYGHFGGLNAANNQLWTVDGTHIQGSHNINAQFGFALAAGDFNDDSRTDLAIGSPGETVSSVNAGAVHVLFGSSSRLSATNSQLWNESTDTSTGGTPGDGDRYGSVLLAGQFNADRPSDLAIGIPNQTVGGATGAGSARVLYGRSSSGLSTTGTQLVNQNSNGMPGNAAANDQFGSLLAAGDFNNDHIGDLYVGLPGQADSEGVPGLDMLAGGSTALTTGTNNQFWLKDGVKILVLNAGTGTTHPTDSSSVNVFYVGRLTNGTVFDASQFHGSGPSTFSVSGVVPGFSEALKAMRNGDVFRVFIPAAQAYGGSPPSGSGIPPNADLIFDIQLDSFT